MFFHWQNLNESTVHGRTEKGRPYRGRCWWHWGEHSCFRLEWNLWSHFCGLSFGIDGEDGLTFHFAIPPLSFWLSLRTRHYFKQDREMSLSVHDWAIWWTVWRDPMGGWDRSVPRWREGAFHILDFLLGRMQCEKEIIETRSVLIPMPEGAYDAKATLERWTRKRKWWFPRISTSVWLEIPSGIPHEGKGENSWDCGTDGLFGCGHEGPHYEDAIAHAVQIVLKDRRRYDGDMLAKYPPPCNGNAAWVGEPVVGGNR